MDQDQQEHKRHVCRFCQKSFSNGKVLGGHMRCHVAKNPKRLAKKRAEALNGNIDIDSKSYGLRVNPKKSTRVSLASSDREEAPLPMEIPCRVCGKAFDSMRALFGHMRHHSIKRKKEACCDDDRAKSGCGGFSDVEGLIGEKLFVEGSGFAKRKRSRRSRCKVSSTTSPHDCSVSNSSVDFDREAEEIAVCLLLLSKGVRKPDELCSADEFLNGDDLETGTVKKSRLDGDSELRFSGCVGFLDDKKLSQLGENDEEKESLSLGVFGAENGIEKQSDGIEMRAVVDHPDETGAGQDCVDRSGRQKIEYKCKTCNRTFHSHQALGGHQTVHRPNKAYHSSQLDDFLLVEAKFGGNEDSVALEAEKATGSEASKERKCPVCFKVFASGQALGGHKRAHMVRDSEAEPEQISSAMSRESCGVSGHVLDTDAELGSPWWVRNNHKHELLVGLVPN